ncbi:hypothetical protein WKK05_05820 [Nostoc sp. UHCC 0302]|uniref:hypothetical protein n=1 Tax=Nostoc sp. UHCC 0302 TaxID=3134896 RepID=UPI00311C93D6
MSKNQKDKVDNSANKLQPNKHLNNEANLIAQESPQNIKTINIDGQRPVDPSSFEVKDTFNIDGQRPITSNDTEVEEIIDIDGERPIVSSNLVFNETLNIDGQRPIDPSDLEIEDILEIDGDRPIVSSNTAAPKITTDYID